MADELIKLYQTMSSSPARSMQSMISSNANSTNSATAVSIEEDKVTRADSLIVASSGPTPCPLIGPALADSTRCTNASSSNSNLKFGSRSFSSNAVVTKVISANNSPVMHNVQVAKSPLSYLNLTEYLSKTTPSPLAIAENSMNQATSYSSGSVPRSSSSNAPIKTERFDGIPAEPKIPKRRREKCSKGLRHFSMKVCEKVKEKGVTSYNEVADELVAEYCSLMSAANAASVCGVNSIDSWYDQKNVRRRVYDALNVLMAMNIISKEKKEIKWIGLPCNKKQECADLEVEKRLRLERIQSKCDQLKDLLLEQIAIKSLVERNVRNELNSRDQSLPWSKILQEQPTNQQTLNTQDSVVSRLKLPFIVINTDNKTVIDCSISDDKKEYVIQLDNTFQINSHIDVLKKLGLTNGLDKTTPCESQDDNCIMENDRKLKKACSMLPKIFEPYIRQMSAFEKIEPVNDPINVPNYQEIIRNQNVKNINKFLKIRSNRHIPSKKHCPADELTRKGNGATEMTEDNESNDFNSLSAKTTTSKSSVNPNSCKAESSKGYTEDDANDDMDENSFENSNEEFDEEFEQDEEEDGGEDDFEDEESGGDDEEEDEEEREDS